MFWMITCLVLLSSSHHGYYGFYPYHVLQPQHEDQYHVLQLQPRNNHPCTLARNMLPTINTRARISLVILYTALVLLYYGLENNRLAADVVQPRSVFNNGTFPHDMCSESPDKMGRSYYYCVQNVITCPHPRSLPHKTTMLWKKKRRKYWQLHLKLWNLLLLC